MTTVRVRNTLRPPLAAVDPAAPKSPLVTTPAVTVFRPAHVCRKDTIDAYGYAQDLYDGYSTLEVGSTWLGVPVDKTLTIKNTGTGTMTLDSASLVLPVGFSVVAPFASTVAPGGSTSITFRLDASSVGPFEGFLSFGSNDADENPFRLTLYGQVSAPEPEMVAWYSDSYGYEQELYDGYGNVYFDSTTVGTSVTRTFRIANAGNGVLTLDPSSLSIPVGFSVVTLFASSVAPGSSTTFTVRLDADWGGQYQGLLSLATNDTDENPFSVWLFGDVSGGEGPPEIRVRDAVPSEIADGTGLVDFGATTVGTAVIRSLTIDNLGVSVLTLDPNTLSLPAGFSLDSPLNSPVAPGATTTLTIRLDAAYAGHFEGSLSFGNNDPEEDPYDFTVRGDVILPQPEVSVAVLNQDGSESGVADGSGRVLVGSTFVGTSVAKTFIIRNTGTATLILDPGSLSLPPGFSVVTPLPLSLAPGVASSFTVRLEATSVGRYEGQMSFDSIRRADFVWHERPGREPV